MVKIHANYFDPTFPIMLEDYPSISIDEEIYQDGDGDYYIGDYYLGKNRKNFSVNERKYIPINWWELCVSHCNECGEKRLDIEDREHSEQNSNNSNICFCSTGYPNAILEYDKINSKSKAKEMLANDSIIKSPEDIKIIKKIYNLK